MRRVSGCLSVLALSVLAMSCAPGTVGGAVQPEAMTASETFGVPPTCDISGFGQPLVVDMPGVQRADLEMQMREGILVVRYDCTTLELLPGCELPGTYEYFGLTAREELVEITKSDELSANVPASAVKLGGRLARGQSLAIALAMVGKQTSTRRQVRRDELEGSCAGATHFARGALVGAFAMRSVRQGEIGTAAELFNVGVSASSQRSDTVAARDGDVAACRGSRSDLDRPLEGCAAPLRLDLVPLDGAMPASEQPVEAIASRCPTGWSWDGGKCSPDAASGSCNYGDATCFDKCAAGDARSCALAAMMHFEGVGAAKSETNGMPLAKKACDSGEGLGCLLYGERVEDLAEKARLRMKACTDGIARGCTLRGFMAQYDFAQSKRDMPLAIQLTERGCRGGDSMGCATLGDIYTMGRDVAKNEAKAVQLYERACEARDVYGCGSLAVMYEHGIHVQRDSARATDLLLRACNAQSNPSGTDVGAKKDSSARTSVSADCPGVQELRGACEGGNDYRACTILSLTHPPDESKLLRTACTGSKASPDPFACLIETKR